jgi:hypothetical protein
MRHAFRGEKRAGDDAETFGTAYHHTSHRIGDEDRTHLCGVLAHQAEYMPSEPAVPVTRCPPSEPEIPGRLVNCSLANATTHGTISECQLTSRKGSVVFPT